jgi:hypothetical protein
MSETIATLNDRLMVDGFIVTRDGYCCGLDGRHRLQFRDALSERRQVAYS